MPRKPRQGRSLVELCIARAGFRKGGRVAEFIASWAIASRQLGRELTAEEVADWWGKGMSYRTAYYRLSEFRQAFPEVESPQAFADVLWAQVDAKLAERANPGALVLERLDLTPLSLA